MICEEIAAQRQIVRVGEFHKFLRSHGCNVEIFLFAGQGFSLSEPFQNPCCLIILTRFLRRVHRSRPSPGLAIITGPEKAQKAAVGQTYDATRVCDVTHNIFLQNTNPS